MSLWSPPGASQPTSPTGPLHSRHSPTSSPPPTTKTKIPGKRVAQIVKLKPEFVREYKDCHARVWPAVLKQIRDCNIEDCT
jgi:hypothetical protein